MMSVFSAFLRSPAADQFMLPVITVLSSRMAYLLCIKGCVASTRMSIPALRSLGQVDWASFCWLGVTRIWVLTLRAWAAIRAPVIWGSLRLYMAMRMVALVVLIWLAMAVAAPPAGDQ